MEVSVNQKRQTTESSENKCFIRFESDVSNIALPKRFTFPFYYDPHPLCITAAKELQAYIENQKDWVHNFGLIPNQEGMVIGKMFGVLIVKNTDNELGYLTAFSGKLAGKNAHKRFVPPIFDMLTEDGFFRKEEEVLNAINRQIEQLENSVALQEAYQQYQAVNNAAKKELSALKQKMKASKKDRKSCREQAKLELPEQDYQSIELELIQESLSDKFLLKDVGKHWDKKIESAKKDYDSITFQIAQLKESRKEKSAALQQQLFDQYNFLNIDQETKNVLDIFINTPLQQPPAGAGECAAPKLLQYAFENNLKPIAIAEFWWGASPKSEIRKHKQFYPACRSKCEPILGHMLKGIDMDENPMLVNPAVNKELEIVHEDEHILVVNKPAEFLSVPGKNIVDSVYSRIKDQYPNATGPLIVHRLDMSTSGIMILAKTKEAHKYLQHQFINRYVKKRYVALLEGELDQNKGEIELPLRVDLDNRPQQLVCYEHGKPAKTIWELIERKNQKTKVFFYPVTGRTHQLRVHAAHASGLNTPIVGDDLYGTKSSRLHLHAESITFKHPATKEEMTIQVHPEF